MSDLQNIELPTPELVNRYIAKFDAENLSVETAMSNLFKAFPANKRLEDVLLKVNAINGF